MLEPLPYLFGFACIIILSAVLGVIGLRVHRKRRDAREEVFRADTKFGTALIKDVWSEDGRPLRLLYVGRGCQSAAYTDEHWLDLYSVYHQVYDYVAFSEGRTVDSMLMIGGGGYSYPKFVMAKHPDVRMEVIEADPAMTDLARTYFGLDRLMDDYRLNPGHEHDGRLLIHHGDGLAFLEQTATTYDVILNDSFGADIPTPSLATTHAAQLIKAHLNPGGLYLSNVVSALEGPQAAFLHQIADTLADSFSHIYVVPCDRKRNTQIDNNILVACDEELRIPDALELLPCI